MTEAVRVVVNVYNTSNDIRQTHKLSILGTMESYSSYSPFALLAIALATIGFVKFFAIIYRQQSYWKNKGVPALSGWTGFITTCKIFLRRLKLTEFAKYVYNSHPGVRYVGTMDFGTPGIVICDPELVKEIGVKHFEHFMDHQTIVDESVDPIFGKNVFSLKGERWREMRNTLSPSFTASKMRFLFELVNQCARQFVDYMEKHPEFASSIETKDAFTRYTNDVIATAAFGISVNSLEDRQNEFFTRGINAAKFGSFLQLIRFLIIRLCPTVAKWLGLSFVEHSTSEFFRRIISETVKVREEKGIVRPDMIHLLMQAREKESAVMPMTIDDIVAQAFIFFLAGFDTSSSLMCFMAHELAMNPDIQGKLRKEVDQFMEKGNGQITYEELLKMEYLDMVVSESLRKYPPVVFIDRLCVKEMELPPASPECKPLVIEPNTFVWFLPYAMHRDPKYFPAPEEFDPERFNEENKQNIVPYTYIPFGIGPRKCIGNRFALMEVKILIAHLMHSFILKPTEKTKHPIVFTGQSVALDSDGGFWVGLEKRKPLSTA